MVAVAIFRVGESYRRDTTNQLVKTANVVAQSVASELDVRSRLLAGFAASGYRLASEGSGLLNSVRSAFEGEVSSYRVRDGEIISIGHDSLSSLSLRELVKQAAAVQRPVVSNLYESDGGVLNLAIAVPQETTNDNVEVAALVSTPQSIIRALTRGRFSEESLVLAVTDGNGTVLARSRDAEKFIGSLVPDWDALKELNVSSGTFEARTIEGPKVMFAFESIRGTPGWVAVVGEPLSTFNSRWQQPLFLLLAVSIGAAVITFFLAAFLTRRILKPIQHLVKHGLAVASGQSQKQLTITEVPSTFVEEFEMLRRSLESAEAETTRSHNAIQQSYEALRQAEKLSRTGSWSINLSDGTFATSDMLYELNGADPNGPPLKVEDLQRLLTPESAERVSKAIANCIATGEPYGLEVEHMRPDGSSFAAYIRGQATTDADGNIVKISGTVQDISERKEERDRLATLANNMPSGAIYRIEEKPDGGLALTYISAGIVRLIGITATEIVEDNQVLVRAIHPEDLDGYRETLEKSRVEGSSVDYQLRMYTTDGREMWMSCRSDPRRQSDGRVVWDGIMRDITGERLAAETLKKAKEAAESAERAKSDFLATMSHEIRTPMNTVIGMTRLTLQTELSHRQKNYLDKIDLSAKTLLGIINDILDFSKIEAGSLELENTKFATGSLLESVSAVVGMQAEAKGLELVYSISPSVPRQIRGDPLRLGQILTNLVGNAVKFTESGEVVISIDTIQKDDGNSYLHFSVRDTGIGLTPEQIAGLFRPFSQANSDTYRKYGGTGLGLAICKQLVQLMGGQIWVESEPNAGAEFAFDIPFLSEGEELPVPGSLRVSGVNMKGMKVLVVDDNASAREVLSEMLVGFGLFVHAVESGADALTSLRNESVEGAPYDLVLLDWRMPHMDGLETAKRIRADETLSHIPAVLMVTAYGWEEVMRGAEAVGLSGFLIKPVTESLLFNTVIDILLPDETSTNTGKNTAVISNVPELEQAPRATLSVSETLSAKYPNLIGMKALVVDDNLLNREVATDFLEIVGIAVDTAVDGVDALEKMNANDVYDVILMDMHMPRMDGLAAVREIRKQRRWRNLPVIALTAQARVEDQNASIEAGMSAHLTKPIDEHVLYRTLVTLFEDVSTKDDGSEYVSEAESDEYEGFDAQERSFDISATMARFGGKVERVAKILATFAHDYGDVSSQLSDKLRSQDLEWIAFTAHSVRGSAGYLNATRLSDSALRLEQLARLNDMKNVEVTAAEFDADLNDVLGDVSDWLEEVEYKPL